jgi:hypothetical protein
VPSRRSGRGEWPPCQNGTFCIGFIDYVGGSTVSIRGAFGLQSQYNTDMSNEKAILELIYKSRD